MVLCDEHSIYDSVHGILCVIQNGVCLRGRLVDVERGDRDYDGDMSTSEPQLAWTTASKKKLRGGEL